MGVMLVCQVRHVLAAFPLDRVIETMRPLPIERLANIPTGVLGVSVIRGAPVPVLDAGALLQAAGDPAFTRYVVLRMEDHTVALAVEAVRGIYEINAQVMGQLPPLLQDTATDKDIVSALGTRDAALLVVLGTARVVPDTIWSSLATVRGVA